MVVDFSKIDFTQPQVLLLKNLDGTPLQPLGFAHNVHAALNYSELSELTFDLPAVVDGMATPHYNDVVGMRLVDWMGVGQFILVNPSTTNDGVKEIKSCKAYSLEYEFSYKKLYIAEGTYNFWNPVAPDNTVLSMILEVMPSWHVGTVDEDLIGKYRTFEVDNQTAYDAMKNTFQDMFQCIFDFDTYERTINVRSVQSLVDVKPVHLSLQNLIKEIELTEDTENIFTALDVNGADGVDIRSVNPMGINKIYNLDYFMNTSYFSQDLIDKWEEWKSTYTSYQQPYFNLTVEKVLQEARLETERAALTELENTLSQYETLQSTYVEASAAGADFSTELSNIKEQIADQQDLIATQTELVSQIETDVAELLAQQQAINAACALSTFLSEDEQRLIDRYMHEDAISEDSFVYRTVSSYTDADVAQNAVPVAVYINNALVTKVVNASGKDIYAIIGGDIRIEVNDKVVTAEVVRSAVDQASNGEFVLTAHLNAGTYDGTSFPSGCISLTGHLATITSDVTEDPDIGGEYLEGSYVALTTDSANLYFTQNATEYAKRSVEWDLFEYGQQCLEELCWPTYNFSISAANFLALEDFSSFKGQFKLGSKVYLSFPDDRVLTPIAIGAEMDFEDPSDFTLIFGDKYSAQDSAFQMVDLLSEAISMGKTVASTKNSFAAFVDSGAASELHSYIQDAIDLSKQAVLSSSDTAIQLDGSGIRLRKYTDETHTAYDPEQMWMINNSIVLTDDNWSTAKMAIGKFTDSNLGVCWGVVAPMLVGTILAGNNLVIESAKRDGGVAVFRVDADGARLYNSQFDLVSDYEVNGVSAKGQISLYSPLGLIGGNATSTAPLFSYDDNGYINGVLTKGGDALTSLELFDITDLPNASFWIDMRGNAFLKGTVIATDGQFTGTIHATDGDFKGIVDASDLRLGGVSIGNIFTAVGDGTYDSSGVEGLDYLQIGNITIDGKSGSITFNGSTDIIQVKYATSPTATSWYTEWQNSWTGAEIAVWAWYSYDGGATWGSPIKVQSVDGADGSDGSDANVPTYIRSTYIDFERVESPTIMGDFIQTLGSFQVGTGSRTNFTATGFMGRAIGADANNEETQGVALASKYANATDLGKYYVIVTDAGVRLQAGDNRIILTEKAIQATDGSITVDLLTSGGGGVAVFGG